LACASRSEGTSEVAASLFKAFPALIPIAGIDLVNANKVPTGSAMIVAACVDDPVEMMGINRDLRAIVPGGTATYFVPFLKAKNEKEAKSICTNLTFGDRGANTYSLHKMYTLYLPEDRDEDSWGKEFKYLLKLCDWLDEQDQIMPRELLDRRAALRTSTATGLVDDLFWPDKNAKALKIRSNFVLLPTEDGKHDLTQADIFVVVSALLNNLRNEDGQDSLKANQFERRVISPANFVKFNDGIIQASILRAARDNELNYVASDTDKYSKAMCEILLKMLISPLEEAREALTEFVLAIAVGRLRMQKIHKDQIAEAIVVNKNALPNAAFVMAKAMLAGIE